MSNRPILLTKEQMLAPIVSARNKLNSIRVNAPSDGKDNIVREGLFVLGVSTVEVMILDILSTYFKYIPAQIPDKSISIPKDTLIDSEFSVIDVHIDNYINGLGYQNLREILNKFCEHLAIDLKIFRDKYEDALQEIKESRNLLIHNDLKVNSFYLAKAGPKARATEIDRRVSIDYKYFIYALDVLDNLCDSCTNNIESKYADYTKYRAIKALWEYIFHTPILDFDDYWQSSPEGDTVFMKKKEFHGGVSTSEGIFLGVWVNHFNMNKNKYIGEFNLARLDTVNKEKMLWFISTLRDFRLY
jgi:hypothetical protein